MFAVPMERGRCPGRGPLRPTCVAAALLLACLAAPCDAAAAEPPVREQTALQFIPEDAACFGTVLHLRQQFDAVAQSRALARLRESPALQMLLATVIEGLPVFDRPPAVPAGLRPEAVDPRPADEAGDERPMPEDESPVVGDWMFPVEEWLRPLKDFCNDPANADLVAFLQDAVSNEVFISVDANAVPFLEQLGEIVRSFNTDRPDGNDPEDIRGPKELVAALPLPAFVIGCKLRDPERAARQVARLETMLQGLLKAAPEAEVKLLRKKIGRHEFLTLRMEGPLTLFETVVTRAAPADDPEEAEGDADPDAPQGPRNERERVAINSSLEVCLGLHGDYLLFSCGASSEHLAKIEGAWKRLADRPELAPVLKPPAGPLTSVRYMSESLSRCLSEQSEALIQLGQFAVEMAAELFEFSVLDGLEMEWQPDFRVIELLFSEGRPEPAPSATTRWTYLTPHGFAGYSYRWRGTAPGAAAPRELSILDHLGGSPLVAMASRATDGAERSQRFSKWTTLLESYLEIWSRQLLPVGREEYSELVGELGPIRERLDAVTRERLLPALSDGQSAFVLDAGAVTGAGPDSAAEGTKAPPLPSLALVWGVSNADLLRRAGREYVSLAQEAASLLHSRVPDLVPPVEIKPSSERDAPDGKLYIFEQARTADTRREIAPTAALNSKIAVLSLAPGQAERLLGQAPFAPAEFFTREIFSQRERPLTALWYVNFAGLVDLAAEWVDKPAGKSTDKTAASDTTGPAAHLLALLEILKCWRGSAGITYFDGPAQVDFYETVLEDLK